ncbi:MAG: repressor LexA [Gammaproteobacteria bacterium RIFCSPHIGHO2_02_FULL_42_13]|nr:MAG: repressor LexA [Gammaproteobacteria bacterium RIFCSPHIGHO2_02_FULL_42_13]OGT70400.1 MAG: repressor LexA [Gammaproteobacteria bacterium RIFCSPLOWO2_02_FULL_42_9]
MITVSQRKAYQYIQRFIRQQGHSPTISEIAEGIGIKSRGVVHRYVQALVTEGLVDILPNRHRNIELTEKDADKHLMLIGKISHNQPLESVSEKQITDVTKSLLAPNRCALRVQGDGMVEEGIFDGDIIICEQTDKVKEDSIVIALIDDKAIVKRLRYNQDQTITLSPIHSRRLPEVYPESQVKIYGIFVAVVRLEK